MQAVAELPSCAAGIISSRNAATLVADALRALPASEAEPLKDDFEFLTVGSKSADALESAGMRVSAAAASGSALAPTLQARAAAWKATGKPVVFFCAEKRLDVIPATLAAAGDGGVPVREVHLYRTQPLAGATITAAVDAALATADGAAAAAAASAGTAASDAAAPAAGIVIVVVFFSPSGVRAFAGSERGAALLARARPTGDVTSPASSTDRVVVIAFGATTAAALRDEHRVAVDGVSPSPDPAGLRKVVEEVCPLPSTRCTAADAPAADVVTS